MAYNKGGESLGVKDTVKSVIVMMDKRTAYLLLAIENQSNIHYAMPVKNMVYDALQYAKQVEEAIDVCLAIQQMNEEAAQKERISTLLNNIKNLMEKMGWFAEQSMDILNVSENDRKALSQLLR